MYTVPTNKPRVILTFEHTQYVEIEQRAALRGERVPDYLKRCILAALARPAKPTVTPRGQTVTPRFKKETK